MNQQIDRAFLEWLYDGPETGSADALARASAAVRSTRQRPGWATTERWFPTGGIVRPSESRFVLLAVVALLMAAVVGLLLLAGARPKPLGIGGNGPIVIDVDSTLYRVEPDGSNPVVLAIGLGHGYSPTFSPDGTRLAFLSRAGETGPFSIFVANADGSGAVKVTGPMEVKGDTLAAMSWAPDASRIVFANNEGGFDIDGGRMVLYVVGVDGAGLRRLPDSGDSRTSPAISPDGTWLAYAVQSVGGPGRSSLGVSRVDGSEARTLVSVDTRNASFRGSQWAPDSRRLAYFRSVPGPHIVAITDLNGRETIVSQPGEDAFNPAWSPDGAKLVYATDNSGSVVVDVATGSRLVIPIALADCGATWAPDGTALLGLGAACNELYWIPLSDPAAATRVDLPRGQINIATWQRVAP